MKEYKSKEFAAVVGCSPRTVESWRISRKGQTPRLLPARYEKKGRVAIYTEEQIPLALALLGKNDSAADDVSVSLFDGSDNNITAPAADVPAVVEETANETDGSEEDDFAVAIPALVPADDSDDDDELIDPPADTVSNETDADGEELQDARAVFPAALDKDTASVEPARRGINLIAHGWNETEALTPDGSETVDFDETDFDDFDEELQFAVPLETTPDDDTITDVPDAPTAAAQIDKPGADVPVEVVDKQARIDAAKKFFDLLFGKLTGDRFGYLWTKQDKVTYPYRVSDADAREKMAQRAIELNDRGKDVYVGVNCGDAPPAQGQRHKANEITVQTAVITDIDIASEAHKGDPAIFATDFNEAKSFLPFPPSIIVHSGFGLHGYYMFDAPLAVTDDNREEIKRRNNRLLDVIRAKAAGKKIDGIGDLPRILRCPGTRNYGCGEDNAPLCHVVEVNDVRFTPADIDARLDALTPATLLTAPIEPARAAVSKSENISRNDANAPLSDDDPDLKAFRIRHMLPCINVVKGQYEKWVQVGMGLFNEGLTCADWEQWSRSQPEFKEGECSAKWLTFSQHNAGIRIGTLYQWAVEGGYDGKAVQRKYYQLHPDKARKSNTTAQIDKLKADLRDVAQKLDDFDKQKEAALERLKTVETFDTATCLADDVIEAVAFAQLYDKKAVAEFNSARKNYGFEHKDSVIDANNLRDCVKAKRDELSAYRHELESRATALQAEIKSAEFIAADDNLRGVKIPDGYSVSDDGIWRAAGEVMEPVCRLPVLIKGKAYDVDSENYKLIMSYKKKGGGWKRLPAQEAATVFDAKRIVGLSNLWLPVTSSNAKSLIDYLYAFVDANETTLPITYTVSRGGWYEFGGQEIFVDPRRANVVTDGGKKVSVVVDDSTFAKALRSKGSLEEWRRAYEMAKSSPVARLMVAASVAVPLLKVLGERNFWVHINAPTRAGKTTALLLGATAVGSEKIIRSFNATKNGLIGAAGECNDYVFTIDEKQVADRKIQEQFGELIYALSNGVSKTKQTRYSTNMPLIEWRIIVLTTGETEMTPDNATGGADTRVLPVNAPRDEKILPADTCQSIRHIVADNFGHVFPLVVDKIIAAGKAKLRDTYQKTVEIFIEKFPDVLPEHARYVAVLTLADALLNSALGADDKLAVYDDAIINAAKSIFPLIPTAAEIDDTGRERDFVIGFIAENQLRFVGDDNKYPTIPTYGKLKDSDGYSYITATALHNACSDGGFNYRKLVADLTAAGFFVAADTVERNRKTRLATVKKQIGKVNVRCYRIRNSDMKASE